MEDLRRSFVKLAMAEGWSFAQAVEMYKRAEVKDENKSSWLDRYLNLKGVRGQAMLENPNSNFALNAAAMPFTNPSTGLGPAMYMPDGFRLQLATSFDKNRRGAILRKEQEDLKTRSYADQAGKGAKRYALGTGILGSLAGAYEGYTQNGLEGGLVGGALGGLGGAALGGGIGALRGVETKAISKYTSEASKQDAINKLTKHPWVHSLPMADVLSSFRRDADTNVPSHSQ